MNETTTRSQARAARRPRSEAQGEFPFVGTLVVPKRPARSRRSAAETSQAEASHAEASHAEASHAEASHAEASHAEASHAEANRPEPNRAEASSLARRPETKSVKPKRQRAGSSGNNGPGVHSSRRNLAPDAPLRRDIIGTTARDRDSSSTRQPKPRPHGRPSRSKPKRPAPRRYGTPTRTAALDMAPNGTQRPCTDAIRPAMHLAPAVAAESIRILLALALIAAAVLV